MTLDELKAAAAKILEIQPMAGFAHETFSCGSGGSPVNRVGVPEVHREDTVAYNTVRHGNAYRGSVTVECRDTGATDAKGRRIYETPAGVVFVFVYRSGSPESFDGGALREPMMEVER